MSSERVGVCACVGLQVEELSLGLSSTGWCAGVVNVARGFRVKLLVRYGRGVKGEVRETVNEAALGAIDIGR